MMEKDNKAHEIVTNAQMLTDRSLVQVSTGCLLHPKA